MDAVPNCKLVLTGGGGRQERVHGGAGGGACEGRGRGLNNNVIPASGFKVLSQILLGQADIDADAAAPSCGFQQDWVPHLHPPTIVAVQNTQGN